jgi:hypothetical protein
VKAIGSVIDGYSAFKAGRFNRRVERGNARKAIDEGEADLGDIARQGRSVLGRQITSLGGSGFEFEGTAFDLLRETQIATGTDMLRRRRAAREEARAAEIRGQAAYREGKAKFVSGVLDGLSKTIDYASGAG